MGSCFTSGSLYIGGSWDHDNNISTMPVMAIFKSSDDGQTWSHTNLNREGGITVLTVNPFNKNIIYAVGYEAVNSGGNTDYQNLLLKSTDGGGVWKKISGSAFNDISIRCLSADPHTSGKLFIGTAEGVTVSTDEGNTWNDLTLNKGINCILPDPVTSGRLFAGTDNGVFITSDGGGLWQSLSLGLISPKINCLEYDNTNDVLYAGAQNGGVS
ncbi:hypothetical protein BVY01_04590, partial [bacterium I07]